MKAFLAKNYILLTILVVILAGGGVYWYVSANSVPSFGATTVQKGNVVESVDEAGTVLAENNASVSFQEGGEIASVNVQEGSVVSAGTVLAQLSTSQLNAAVQQANAALAGAQAQLSQLQSGTRPQQLTIDESAVTSADQSLGIAVGDAYASADDAVTNQLDTMFSTPQSNNPMFLVPSSNSQTINNINSQRLTIGGALTQWYAALNATSTDPASLSAMSQSALTQIQSYIDTIALVVNDATPNATLPAASLATYKADIATARNEVQASIGAVSGDSSALTAAQNALTLAQAGSTPQQIATQEAVVAQAQAAVTSAQVALNNASLVAPFSGTVQGLTAQVGQVVAPGAPVLSLINNSGLKIQAYVPENDVAQVQVGDTADVTLDAFGTGTIFPATVTTVDAAQTQVNGSPAYLITLHFVNPNSEIKDGMSGNVHIIEAEHDNVMEVPSNLVINNDNSYFVLVPNGKTTTEQPVQIGIVGNNGMTEITSGLSVGETITNF
jgi:HlyD family secretion protein